MEKRGLKKWKQTYVINHYEYFGLIELLRDTSRAIVTGK